MWNHLYKTGARGEIPINLILLRRRRRTETSNCTGLIAQFLRKCPELLS